MNSISRILGLSTLAFVLVAPAAHADEGKTRAQARDELIAAQKSGDIVLYLGKTGRELFPSRYAQATDSATGKSREQVRAELVAAQMSGDVAVYLGMTARDATPGRFSGAPAGTAMAEHASAAAKAGTN